MARYRVGRSEDIASTILLSGAASFVINRTVTVDVGRPQADEEKPS
jgi:hypothetical protein